MPTYEYRCTQCQHEFDLLVRMGAKPPAKCPKCGAGKVERELSLFAGRKRENAGDACSLESG